MLYKDLKPNQEVYVDAGFTCMSEGIHTIKQNEKGEFYLQCSDGEHLLDGQKNHIGVLIGIYKEKPNE